MNIPQLKTHRTQITLLQPDQAPLLADYYRRNQDHLAPWEGLREPNFYSEADCRMRIEKNLHIFEQGSGLAWAALSPDAKQIVATCGLSNIVRGLFQACNLGYSVDAQCQGQGIMREVLEAVIAYAFKELQLHRIMANYMPHNLRSERLLQSLGFEREGYAKSYLKIAGQWQDHVLTALINPA